MYKRGRKIFIPDGPAFPRALSNRLVISSGSIRPLSGGTEMGTAEISNSELITNLFDSARETQRPIRYEDLPPKLVQAILSAEDKRFFEHPRFDFIRISARPGRTFGTASTCRAPARSQCRWRGPSFSTDRTWRRSFAEAMLSFELEQRFSKQQIFEMYANEVYLGNRGSFGIRGFAEASEAYFGKDLRQLNLQECMFLAG